MQAYQAQLHQHADALNIKGAINGDEDYRSTGSYSLEGPQAMKLNEQVELIPPVRYLCSCIACT